MLCLEPNWELLCIPFKAVVISHRNKPQWIELNVNIRRNEKEWRSGKIELNVNIRRIKMERRSSKIELNVNIRRIEKEWRSGKM